MGRVFVWLLLGALAACGRETAAPRLEGVESFDSAGVRIVVNPDPARASVPRLTLAPDALLEIGTSGGAEYELFRVRGGVILPDGGVAFINGATAELRFFNRDGRFRRSSGGPGEGPGEFGPGVQMVGRFAGDSLLLFEQNGARFAVLDADGRFARTFRVPLEIGLTVAVGVLSDGGIVVRAFRGVAADSLRLGTPALLADRTGQLVRTVADVWSGATMPVVEGPRTYMVPVFFGHETHLAAAGDRIVIADTENFDLRVHDANGVPRLRIRHDGEPRPLTDDDYRRRLEQLMRGELGVEIVRLFAIEGR